MTLSLLKRRRVENESNPLSKATYMAHPFSKINGLKLLDDIHLDKSLSLSSLTSDIDINGGEKTNAVPRLMQVESEFAEF